MGKGTIVLAYSGGLDTSICIPLLKERYEYTRVVTVAVNVGQRDEEIDVATEKGKKLADKHYTIDAREKFVKDHIFPAIKANGSYEGYPMGTSLARPLIAEEVVKIAKKEKATAIGHGCTGKGNDQLRFDFIIRGAGLEVVAPIRELNLTRDWEIDYAKKHKIPVPVKKDKPWSMDENCWSRSIEGGELENPAYHPPEEIYLWTVSPEKAPAKPEKLTLEFKAGDPGRDQWQENARIRADPETEPDGRKTRDRAERHDRRPYPRPEGPGELRAPRCNRHPCRAPRP